MRARGWTLLLALILAGCAHGPRVLNLGTPELAARLAKDFPVDRRLLELFDVRVSDPRIETDPASNRLRADVRIQALDRLGGGRLDTRLAVIAGLRWEARDRTLRLERVDLDLPPRGAGDADRVRRIGLLLASRLFEDHVLWRAPPGATLAVQRITVTPAGLELALTP